MLVVFPKKHQTLTLFRVAALHYRARNWKRVCLLEGPRLVHPQLLSAREQTHHKSPLAERLVLSLTPEQKQVLL